MKEYSDLFPEELCPDIGTMTKQDVLYLGSRTIMFLSRCWSSVSAYRMDKAISTGDAEEVLASTNDAQTNRERADQLAILAIYADDSKPQIFPPTKRKDGEHITYFVQDSETSGHLVNAVIMRAEVDERGDQIAYWLQQCGRENTSSDEYRFVIPDNVSVFQSEDVSYYRHNKNFLRTALNLRTTNDAERGKIDAIVNAFCA